MNLGGQHAVVFGAARGIGLAIANSFAGETCDVLGFDLCSPEDDQANPAIRWIKGDVSDCDDVSRIHDVMPKIDHAVFAVGIGSGIAGSPFWNLQPADWSRVLEVNLMGAVNMAHEIAPRMAERKRGTISFVVSVAGQIGSPTDPPYSAAKAGLINFMQVVARDCAPYGVRANAISPGMVQTDLNRAVWKASQQSIPTDQQISYATWADQKITRICPLGRWQTVGEIATMAVFLASDHARNITGQTINIDGGQVMHS